MGELLELFLMTGSEIERGDRVKLPLDPGDTTGGYYWLTVQHIGSIVDGYREAKIDTDLFQNRRLHSNGLYEVAR